MHQSMSFLFLFEYGVTIIRNQDDKMGSPQFNSYRYCLPSIIYKDFMKDICAVADFKIVVSITFFLCVKCHNGYYSFLQLTHDLSNYILSKLNLDLLNLEQLFRTVHINIISLMCAHHVSITNCIFKLNITYESKDNKEHNNYEANNK